MLKFTQHVRCLKGGSECMREGWLQVPGGHKKRLTNERTRKNCSYFS